MMAAMVAMAKEIAADPNSLPADVEALEALEALEVREVRALLGLFERASEVLFYPKLAMDPLVALAVAVAVVGEVKMFQAIRMVVTVVVAAEVVMVVLVAAGM